MDGRNGHRDYGLILGILGEDAECDNESPYDHSDLTNRIKRTLYYDPLKKPDKDTLSYSATESAVSCFRDIAPKAVGKLGHRYASRVARDACISPCALLLGLIYIERLKNKNPKYLENISSSDLFLISMMVSSKYLYDEGCEEEVFNDEWAISGEMGVGRVNTLEREFLQAIDWRLYVHPHEFSSMLNSAEANIALSNGRKRGWLTYSDLLSLLDSRRIYDQLSIAVGILSKAACVCFAVYGGLVCTTAATSMALIAMSSRASEGRQFGPLPYQQENIFSINDTISDRPEHDYEDDIVPPVARELNRHRVATIPSRIRKMANANESVFHNMKYDNTSVTVEATSGTDASYNSSSITHPKQSVCSIVEAVLLMAHVPTFCTRIREEIPAHCPHCGIMDPYYSDRYITKGKRPLQRSVHADHLPNIRPRLQSGLVVLNRGSMRGLYNPTLPPIPNFWETFKRTPSATVVAH